MGYKLRHEHNHHFTVHHQCSEEGAAEAAGESSDRPPLGRREVVEGIDRDEDADRGRPARRCPAPNRYLPAR